MIVSLAMNEAKSLLLNNGICSIACSRTVTNESPYCTGGKEVYVIEIESSNTV
jgi:hypothetical protein